MKVLAVDDDPDILELIDQALQAIGTYDVTSVLSGRDCLQLLEQTDTTFDCILLDILMPEMNGIELCKNIRAMPEYRFVPIIMVTAVSDKGHVDKAFSSGATDYLNKPFDIFDLKNRISLAEKSAFQSQQLAKDVETIEVLHQNVATTNFHNVSETIPIEDVDGALRAHAFENYLKHMNKSQFSQLKIFSVVVRNIQSIYDRCTGREFADQVTDIAEAISNSLRGSTPFMVYLGNGIYTISVGRNVMNDLNQLQANIEVEISKLEMVFRDGSAVDVDLRVVEVAKPRNMLLASNKVDFIEKLMHPEDEYSMLYAR